MPLAHGIGVRVPVPQPCRAALKSRQYNAFLTLHRATRLGHITVDENWPYFLELCSYTKIA